VLASIIAVLERALIVSVVSATIYRKGTKLDSKDDGEYVVRVKPS
jgi:hypothetical protein